MSARTFQLQASIFFTSPLVTEKEASTLSHTDATPFDGAESANNAIQSGTLGHCRSARQLRIERAERVLPHRHDRDAKLFRQQLPERLQFSSAKRMENLLGCSYFSHDKKFSYM